MKHLNMSLFPFLKEVAFLNNKVSNTSYVNGYTSIDILLEGSKSLPRKAKKKLKKLIKNDSTTNS